MALAPIGSTISPYLHQTAPASSGVSPEQRNRNAFRKKQSLAKPRVAPKVTAYPMPAHGKPGGYSNYKTGEHFEYKWNPKTGKWTPYSTGIVPGSPGAPSAAPRTPAPVKTPVATAKPVSTVGAYKMPPTPTIPGTKLPDYGAIYRNQEQLNREYQAVKNPYTPGTFEYDKWDTASMEQKYAQQAQERVAAETAARTPVWAEQMSAADRNWQAALEASNMEQARGIQGINAGTQQNIGALSAMAANAGMNAGMGAMANDFGVRQVGQGQVNDLVSQMAQQRVGYGAERANALGAIGAERAGWLGGLPALQQAYANEGYDRAYNQYNTDYGRDYQRFADYESRMADWGANDVNMNLSTLAARGGLLNDRAALYGDYASRQNEGNWARYNAGYTQYQDQRDFQEGRTRYGIDSTAQAAVNNATLNQNNQNTQYGLMQQAVADYRSGAFPTLDAARAYYGI